MDLLSSTAPSKLPAIALWYSIILLCTAAPAFSFTGHVAASLDGDTIEVLPSAGPLHSGKAERIRLTRLDCPEKKQPFGQRAKQAASTLSFGQYVTVHVVGKIGIAGYSVRSN